MKFNSGQIIKFLAIYSSLIVIIVSILVLNGYDINPKPVIKMALGLIIIWIILLGTLMYLLRNKISNVVKKIQLDWRIKFVIFAIILALIEEAIAVLMTNLAKFFGSQIGVAYITASSNFFHTVLFHSAIVFFGMFIAWSYLLSKYDFSPNAVFLIFGLTGTLAEASINPSSLFAGFWFFVYGLMIYLPVYSLPKRKTIKPTIKHYVVAIVLTIIVGISFKIMAELIRTKFGIIFFTD